MSGRMEWAPFLPWPVIVIFAVIVAVFMFYSLYRQDRGGLWRGLFLAAIIAMLVNPVIIREIRQPENDVVIVVIDQSASQTIVNRARQTRQAYQSVVAALKTIPGLDIKKVVVTSPMRSQKGASTRLFTAYNRAKATIPADRFGGAIFISDGQIHDFSQFNDRINDRTGPVHVLLSGEKNEIDRQLIIKKSPKYALVGKPARVVFQIRDFGAMPAKTPVRVELRINDRVTAQQDIIPEQSAQFSFTLDRAGEAVLSLSVEARSGEISLLNNQAALSVNGVRERLKVLLVSGQPHPGERTWRNLLKSDASVDLAHFTILRPPEKSDFTPLNELSLITFPVQELFQTRLKEFDLIVFDRYLVRNVLPPSYMRGINDFVRSGGALLFVVGPEYAQPGSLYNTPLSEVLPFKPNGQVLEEGFAAETTDIGQRHPVTAGLEKNVKTAARKKQNWGRWLRQIDGQQLSGNALLSGIDGKPLLILDRVEKGRVAVMTSDQVWLWARGFEGGGPYGELIRKLAHWLMKEPDLEEENLRARIKGNQLLIRRDSLSPEAPPITITQPSGKKQIITPKTDGKGPATARIPVQEMGLYRVSGPKRTALAYAGFGQSPEMSDLRSNMTMAKKIAGLSGGGVFRINQGIPDITGINPGVVMAGKSWIGVVRNNAYQVKDSRLSPAIPPIMVLLLGGLLILASWWREGR